jgi:hypothetical protein
VGDAFVPVSSTLANALGLRKWPELPLLAIVLISFVLIVWFVSVVVSKQERCFFDFPRFAHVVDGHIVPFSEAELHEVINQTGPDTLSRCPWLLSSPEVLVAELLAGLEAFLILISLPLTAILARAPSSTHFNLVASGTARKLGSVGPARPE